MCRKMQVDCALTKYFQSNYQRSLNIAFSFYPAAIYEQTANGTTSIGMPPQVIFEKAEVLTKFSVKIISHISILRFF
jgi:hypothetical protein